MKLMSKNRFLSLLLIFAVLLSLLTSCQFEGADKGDTTTSTTATTLPNPTSGRIVSVHFIDVGNADAILIETEDGNMLIDTGDTDTNTALVRYLDSEGITELDWLVLTHPHADHIGGAATVLNRYDVKRVMLPDATNNSYTYRNTISAMLYSDAEIYVVDHNENKVTGLEDVTAEVWSAGHTFTLGELSFLIINPIAGDGELNNISIGLHMTYGNTTFLFTGDMEGVAENKAMLEFGFALDCDVLKVGHHGSGTSTSKTFLQYTTPTYAFIPCGAGNSYGHPHTNLLNRLKNANVTYSRADEYGSVLMMTNGQDIIIIP